MAATPTTPKVPPRWFVRGAWIGHRLLYRTTGKGLARPRRDGKMGMLRLHTVGRKSGSRASRSWATSTTTAASRPSR